MRASARSVEHCRYLTRDGYAVQGGPITGEKDVGLASSIELHLASILKNIVHRGERDRQV